MKMTSHFKHKQVGGDHYERLAIQPIEFSLGNDLGPCETNIVKYITREKKDVVNDLRKARQYAQFILEMEANPPGQIRYTDYSVANNLDYARGKAIEYVIKWSKTGDTAALSKLLEVIDVIIEREIGVPRKESEGGNNGPGNIQELLQTVAGIQAE